MCDATRMMWIYEGDHIGKTLATALMNDGNAMWNANRRRDAGREMDYGHYAFWKIVRCNVLAAGLNLGEPYNFDSYTADPATHSSLCGVTSFYDPPKVRCMFGDFTHHDRYDECAL